VAGAQTAWRQTPCTTIAAPKNPHKRRCNRTGKPIAGRNQARRGPAIGPIGIDGRAAEPKESCAGEPFSSSRAVGLLRKVAAPWSAFPRQEAVVSSVPSTGDAKSSPSRTKQAAGRGPRSTAGTDVAVVLGTRPEAIKLAPVVLACRRRRMRTTVVLTNQQPDLAQEALGCFGITPDISLPPRGRRELSETLGEFLTQLDTVLRNLAPRIVITQGDTSSALAASIAAFHRQIPIVHVEAGLRTHTIEEPFPEEAYRQALARFVTLHCAPTQDAARNLLLEGIPAWRITITGNPIVDAFRWTLRRSRKPSVELPRPYVVVTAHRRENRGERFEALAAAILDATELRPDLHWLVFGHPNGWFSEAARELLRHARVRFMPPQPYDVFLRILAEAEAWVSDSGGLQEEACCLQKPLLICRASTERQEAIEVGWCRAVDPSARASLSAALERLVLFPWQGNPAARNPFGDGHAARRIAQRVRSLLTSDRSRRPVANAA